MSQLGWVNPANGEDVPFADALGEAEKYGSWGGYPSEVLKGMFSNEKSARPEGASVTQLLGCPRRVHLEKLMDYYGDIAGSYAMFRGTLGHTLLEQHAPAGTIVEKRYFRLYKGIELSGALDSWRIVGTDDDEYWTLLWDDWLDAMWRWEQEMGKPVDEPLAPLPPTGARFLIRDWKSRHELPFGTYMPVKHQKQGNSYRWLLRIPVELADVEFVYFSMEGVKVIPLFRGGHFKNGRPKPEQMMTDKQVEVFLDERLVPLALSAKLDRPIPYDRVSEDDLWNCKYCPAIALCHKLAAAEAQAAWKKGETVDRLPPR